METIAELEQLIKGMKADGEIFGLVNEDYEKIKNWENKIHKALDTNDGFCKCGSQLLSELSKEIGSCWECR